MESLIAVETEGGVLHGHLHWLVALLEWAASLIDLIAIAILLIGAARFVRGLAVAEVGLRGPARMLRVNRERCDLGRYTLAGLELFIVSDVIHTALSLKFSDLLFLLLLVIIRSITSYFLDREMKEIKEELPDD